MIRNINSGAAAKRVLLLFSKKLIYTINPMESSVIILANMAQHTPVENYPSLVMMKGNWKVKYRHTLVHGSNAAGFG